MNLASVMKSLSEVPSVMPALKAGMERLNDERKQLHMSAWYSVSTHHSARDFEVHPSALSREPECARYHLYEHLCPQHKTDRPAGSTLMKFDLGTAVHAWLQALCLELKMIEPVGFSHHEPAEMRLRTLFPSIRGKTDATSAVDGVWEFWDFKTMAHDYFMALLGPKSEHALQAQIYMKAWNEMRPQLESELARFDLWAVSDNDEEHPIPLMQDIMDQMLRLDPKMKHYTPFADTKHLVEAMLRVGPVTRARIIYLDKDQKYKAGVHGLPTREFPVSAGEEAVREAWSTAKAASAAWENRRDYNTLPSRPCPTMGCQKASRCPHRNTCFQTDKFSDLQPNPRQEESPA